MNTNLSKENAYLSFQIRVQSLFPFSSRQKNNNNQSTKMTSAMRSQHSMTRMLACFEQDARNFLHHVENEFNASNRQFDEHFREMFIRTSTDR